MQLSFHDAPAAPPIPKAFKVGPNSLLTALAICKRNHDQVQASAKEEVERRHFMKQVWQMEQAAIKSSKANKKADKAKKKMESIRGKAKNHLTQKLVGKTLIVKHPSKVTDEDFQALREVYDHQSGYVAEGEYDAMQTGQVCKGR
jgi:putative N-acetylmannosamine-6-phosphate epimerase